MTNDEVKMMLILEHGSMEKLVGMYLSDDHLKFNFTVQEIDIIIEHGIDRMGLGAEIYPLYPFSDDE